MVTNLFPSSNLTSPFRVRRCFLNLFRIEISILSVTGLLDILQTLLVEHLIAYKLECSHFWFIYVLIQCAHDLSIRPAFQIIIALRVADAHFVEDSFDFDRLVNRI